VWDLADRDPFYTSSTGKIKKMSRVEEIERAIEELSPDEFRQVAQRVHAIEEARWDKRLDAAAGKLDFLREEAQANRENDLLKDWPPRG
jgi:hypothetical protein